MLLLLGLPIIRVSLRSPKRKDLPFVGTMLANLIRQWAVASLRREPRNERYPSLRSRYLSLQNPWEQQVEFANYDTPSIALFNPISFSHWCNNTIRRSGGSNSLCLTLGIFELALPNVEAATIELKTFLTMFLFSACPFKIETILGRWRMMSAYVNEIQLGIPTILLSRGQI